ncbi:Lactyl (2) diphospho-(5')guanosine:7,8-didemethyl-8-hydroxy-5-deazariboflavin 2-phospho-L-lactate transferase [hydrothermal vent metagenome]|uniref:Lactyl (2) diphospho-(5')guanosine:7,8-didemethyl-8-hydroxy-5-deazariboflavin 2-phospho-L-lactate transferase n=1 Tax=hydrothermal vent metagenome TaxID=652676 RepID=A0A3B0S2A6_9ZZZZ
MLKVTLLAGGVGGAKMAEGFDGVEGVELSVIGNVADDAEFHGLWVSPDIDTLTYSLANRIDRAQGWGVADESHRALDVLNELGEDTWMTLGDRDFGLHIYRSHALARGQSRSDIAAHVARVFGVTSQIILPTDDVVQTRVRVASGWLTFQEYFVRERCRPEVLELEFEGIDAARPTPAALEAISTADLIVLAPSNPLVSIDPILNIPGIRAAISAAKAPKIAVSPLIEGKTIKGPAARMMTALGLRADALGVAQHYQGLITTLVIDHADSGLSEQISALDMAATCEQTLMQTRADKIALARAIIGGLS